MRFVDRLSTLIQADAHGVVESLEDRRLLAKQFLREAKLSLDEKRRALAQTEGELKRLAMQSGRMNQHIERLDQDVSLAVQQQQDDLARAAIRKLLPIKQTAQHLAERSQRLEQEQQQKGALVAAQEQALETLKARLSTELDALAAGGPNEEFATRTTLTEEDVELELLRRRSRPGKAEAAAEKEPR